jgi:hypothetical protein
LFPFRDLNPSSPPIKVLTCPSVWGHANLNDPRRIRRLVSLVTARQCQSAGPRLVKIPQRGGGKARAARLDIKFARVTKVTLKAPANKASGPDIPLYYVGCIEQGEAADRRWLIEDSHKVWKSVGTPVEAPRMQSWDNLTRMCVILAFNAVRLLHVRFIKKEPSAQGESCEVLLGVKSWKLLWLKM